MHRLTYIYPIRTCMESTWTRKVRSNIFKSRPSRSELLSAIYGFTGSTASVVLLDILNEVMDAHRSDIHVVYIDISGAMPASSGWTAADTESQLTALRAAVDDKYNGRWKLDIVSLEQMLNMTTEALSSLISSFSADKTSQEDLLSYLVRSALIRYSRLKSIHRIITAETASTLSVKAISSCAKGRGFQMAEEGLLVDHMTDLDLVWAIPMRENIVDREVACYFWDKKLTAVVGPRLVPLAISETKSINGLTRNFMMSLQRGFDHSMHTILSSIEKLITTPNPQPSESDASASQSTSSSSTSPSTIEVVSAATAVGQSSVRCSLCTCLLSASERSNHRALCFSCNKMLGKSTTDTPSATTATEMDAFLRFQTDSVLAPPGARTEQPRRHQVSKVSRREMRDKIREYLVEQPSDDDANLGALMDEE